MAFRLLWHAVHNQYLKESLCCLYKSYSYREHEQKPSSNSHPMRESYEKVLTKEDLKWTLISFSKPFTNPLTRGIFAFSLQTLTPTTNKNLNHCPDSKHASPQSTYRKGSKWKSSSNLQLLLASFLQPGLQGASISSLSEPCVYLYPELILK